MDYCRKVRLNPVEDSKTEVHSTYVEPTISSTKINKRKQVSALKRKVIKASKNIKVRKSLNWDYVC